MTPRPAMNAVILAAGRGIRLRPLTDQLPKPLLPVFDRPILGHIVGRLRQAGIRSIGVNLCYKAQAIHRYLTSYPDVQTVVEKTAGDTGAPLKYFRDILTGDFLVHNCDFISDIDIRAVISFHRRRRALATWVLVKNPGTDLVSLRDDRIIALHGRTDRRCWTFTGLAIYSDRLFDYFPDRPRFGIKEPIRRALRERQVILGFRWRGFWRDIGTPRAYWRLHADLMRPSRSYISPTSQVRTNLLRGFYCIGDGCYLGTKVSLQDTVVLPGTRIVSGRYTSCVIGHRFIWRYRGSS